MHRFNQSAALGNFDISTLPHRAHAITDATFKSATVK